MHRTASIFLYLAWRRKLVRYLSTGAASTSTPVLAATTSQERARNIAHLAADLGVPVLATAVGAIHDRANPHVYDAVFHRRVLFAQSSSAPIADTESPTA